MSALRALAGAAIGAATAAAVLRVRAVAAERHQPMLDTIGALPEILAEDVARVAEAARHAVADGQAAAARARIDFDEQVAGAARRTKEQHD